MIWGKLIAFAVVAMGIFAGGYEFADSRGNARYADLESRQAQAEKTAADQAVEKLQAATKAKIDEEAARTLAAETATKLALSDTNKANAKMLLWEENYQKAIKESKTCEVWASQPIACPL